MTAPRLRPAVVSGGLSVLVFAAVVLAGPGGHTTRAWADDLGRLAVLVVATTAAYRAVWRAEPADRLGWALLAAGLAAWGAGAAARAAQELGTGSLPFPSAADAGHLVAAPLAVMAVWWFRSGGRTADRPGAPLDGAVIAGSLLLVSWVLVLGPASRAGSGSALSQAIAIAYPVGDVVIATTVLVALARAHRWRENPLVLVGTGVLAVAVGESAKAGLLQAGHYRTGNPVDVLQFGAFLAIGLAAWASSRPLIGDERLANGDGPHLALFLPYAALACAMGAAAYSFAAGVEDLGMEVTSAVVVVAVTARQLFLLLDTRALAAALRDKVAEVGTRDQEVQRLAFLDLLTGLPNRSAFLEAVETAAARAAGPLSVLFIDLDDFKAVNDTLGHAAGDELLVEAASRLRAAAAGLAVARLGGDEFGVLVDDEGAASPMGLAAKLHEALRSPFALTRGHMVVRASVGIAHSEDGAATADELLRQADVAMYAAKRRGKGGSQVFGPDLSDGATERVLLRTALASALDADALDLWYQPIVELVTGRVWGVEALSRWGTVPPAEFIPLSEETGLIHQLGRLVLVNACAEAAGWPGGANAPVVSVNLSPEQLQDASVLGVVSDALAASGLPPDRLMLEVPERVLVDQGKPAIDRLAALREMGVRVAIDSFGSGSSSLRYLPRFPVDVIKIDQGLVRGVDEGAAGLAVLRAIVELADQLGLDTVAEGIEEIRQADALASVGCRSGQGFWYRKPVPATQLWPLPSGAVLRRRVPSR